MSDRPPLEIIVWNKSRGMFATAFVKDTEHHPADFCVFKYPGGEFTRRSTRIYQRDLKMTIELFAYVEPVGLSSN